MKRETFELSGSVGLHTVNFKLAVSGDGTISGQSEKFSTETASATAPLPVIGLRGLWQSVRSGTSMGRGSTLDSRSTTSMAT